MPDLWRPVPEFPGYWASWHGKIIGLRGTILRPAPTPRGYLHVDMWRDGAPGFNRLAITVYVHDAVTAAFLGPKPEGLEVCHLNGDNGDNWLGNLAYGTHSQNMQHSIEHGTYRGGFTDPEVARSAWEKSALQRRNFPAQTP